MQNRTLIVKLGYSETFISNVRTVCSLGDVLRTTPILHLFENDEVTWLTDAAAVPLLRGNPHINHIVTYCSDSMRQLETQRFDTIVNLEKVPDVCGMTSRMTVAGRYGFHVDAATGRTAAGDEAYDALVAATHDEARLTGNRSWTQLLFAMLGAEWHGESYILGYSPRTDEVFDIGFNTQVGSLFPVKAWPHEQWQTLETLLDGSYTTAYQQCLDDLEGYMDWINSCRLIVTGDSLGLHLGLALGKKVVALFGPTPASDLDQSENLKVIVAPLDRDCIPCCRAECMLNDSCMPYITPRMVLEAAKELLHD